MSAASKKFDLAAQLAALNADVPKSGTDRMQVEHIDIDRIVPDPGNFYRLSDIEQLAADIELLGLQQPLLVRPGEGDSVVIVSGHRRHAALRMLVDDGHDELRRVPCIRTGAAASPAWQGLQLIYANAHTRALTSAETSQQAALTEQYLYQLKEEGHEFPGRMRDHVAQVVGVTKSKLARLKVVRDGLAPDVAAKYWSGDKGKDLTESAAHALAHLPHDLQRQIVDAYRAESKSSYGCMYLSERTVTRIAEAAKQIGGIQCAAAGGRCSHMDARIGHAVRALVKGSWSYVPCSTCCCGACPTLADCPDVCPDFAAEQKTRKAEARAARNAARDEQEALDRPQVERIDAIWQRFGQLRRAAGLTVGGYSAAIDCRAPAWDAKAERLECGVAKVNPRTTLPYGYSVYLSDVDRWCAAAEALGCTVDYLMCRTDAPRPAAPAPECQTVLAAWMPGGLTPPEPCECVCDFRLAGGVEHRRLMRWDGAVWRMRWSDAEAETEVIRWLRLPEVREEDKV